jgi:flagellin
MPLVINTNSAATTASFNLSKSNEALRKSLGRLSSGQRITSPADDAGGLAVALKLASKTNRTQGVIQNVQNARSYLQIQDGVLESVGKVLDRMSELRTMAQDITKNSSDIENYSKEFIELQSQLKQIKNETFNGISLFGAGGHTGGGFASTSVSVTETGGGTVTYDKYGRTLYTHPGGQTNDGSISINMVNLQYVLSVGTLAGGATGVDLGNVSDTAATGTNISTTTGEEYIQSILEVSVGQFTLAIERLASMRAENGAEQNRATQVEEMLQASLVNLEAAHGRIMDADIALESTRFAKQNVLVQAGAAMTAQANQLTNVALALLG